ncbi:MAG: hypothetical protein KDK10_13475 [Maritimibacter sp.]|nr:hypothetical protein [Maritimibacter sp.]
MRRAALWLGALLAACAGPACAQSLGLAPLTDRFAACSGRLAGLMEQQWLGDDPASAVTEAQLATMRELAASVAAPDEAGAVLARETEAKLAFERLIARAEAPAGDWAEARARDDIAACTALLLD